MSHTIEQDIDSSWKSQLQERFTKSLEVMLQGALIAYENKLAELPSKAHEARYKLQLEYTQDQKNLKSYADEELKFAIAKEERERQWCLQSVQQQQLRLTEDDQGGDDDDDDEDAVALWKQNVVHDQVMILNAIKNQTTTHHTTGGLFQQGSSSKPLLSSSSSYGASSSSKLLYHHSSDVSSERNISSDIQKGQQQTQLVAPDLESRLRIERHEKQQEEFRKRAEEIQQRKRKERGWDSNYPESLSSSSSTSSDQESSTTDNTSIYSPSPPSPDVVSRVSEQEYESLVIFHDQQWDWINSLANLQWTDFPWPVLSFSNATTKEDLTLEAVADYVFAPIRLHHDRAMSKERLKEIIRRWHPDRFEVKYLTRIVNLHEREMVREGAGMVVRFLNDLLGKWNDV